MRSRAQTVAAALLFCIASFITAVSASGQEYRAMLSGTIRDTSGAALPGVTVTIIETRTGASTVVVSNASGQYVAPFLAPGGL